MSTELESQEISDPQPYFTHPVLGPLTEDEFRYMRQVPMGYDKAEWTPERLANIRKRFAMRTNVNALGDKTNR